MTPVDRATYWAVCVRRAVLAALLVLLVIGPRPAGAGDQPADSGKAAKAPEPVEVRFIDNSSLKLVLRDEHVGVVTRYGRLSIPVADIRRVEFATRVPDDIARRIEAAVKDLANPQFKLREAACAELRGFRERAYAALLQAAKSGDPEAAHRAEELLQGLREAVPADQLDVRPQDVVYTDDMKVTGRIEALVLKASTFQFGDQALKLADLRSLRSLSAATAEAEPANALPDPGHLENHRNQIGASFLIRVTGAVAGSVWGTDVYTSDSRVAAAAVHAGVLQPGQTGVVRVTIVPAPAVFAGSTRNGVASSAYGAHGGAYRVSRPTAGGG